MSTLPEAPADATPVRKLALRDTGLALAALSLWAAADAWNAATGLGFAKLLGFADGVAVGIGLGLLAHEWGHFGGARFTGGIAPTRAIDSFFPIFDFDLERSDPGAFRAMSVGGNLAHWAVVVVLVVALPLDTTARAALVAGAFGFAVFSSKTEIPVIQRAYSGCSPIESFAGYSREKLRSNVYFGIAAGLLLFLIL